MFHVQVSIGSSHGVTFSTQNLSVLCMNQQRFVNRTDTTPPVVPFVFSFTCSIGNAWRLSMAHALGVAAESFPWRTACMFFEFCGGLHARFSNSVNKAVVSWELAT
jgi:hypothetical protein